MALLSSGVKNDGLESDKKFVLKLTLSLLVMTCYLLITFASHFGPENRPNRPGSKLFDTLMHESQF